MSWPRLWRLWQEPRPGSTWEVDGSIRHVWYAEGAPRARYIVARLPHDLRIARAVRLSLWDWRRWWVFAREVR